MKISSLSLLMALGVLTAVQGDRKCTSPMGNDGVSYTEGCLKMTCKVGVWRSSLDASLCCYNRQPYHPNTTITATEDGCATAVIYCKQEEDVANVVLQVENNCGEYSTVEQMQEIKHLLVKHMEHTDCDKDSSVPISASSTTTTPTHATEGILVSGGWGDKFELFKSVELFIPETGKTCSFNDLPVARISHTMNMVGDALVVCGGRHNYEEYIKSCVHLSPPSSSVWTSYATIGKGRYWHTAWVSPIGELLLVGGYGNGDDNALIVNAGTSTDREIRLEPATPGRHCGIDAKDSVIITGGYGSERIVTQYNLQGHVENLPEMTQGRAGHGCSSYLSDGTLIIIVAGGLFDREAISSTERMAIGAAAWTTMDALPRALYAMASVTVGNLVYLTGGVDGDDIPRSEILVLGPGPGSWSWREVGQLQTVRASHAATMIDTASFMDFCKW